MSSKGFCRRITCNTDQYIVFDFMFLQKVQPAHNTVKCSFSFLVAAIAVMNFLWTIKADSHHKTMPLQKFAPIIIKQRSISLQGVFDYFLTPKGSLQFDYLFEKINSQKCRLTSLPDKFHNRRRLRLDVFRYKCLENCVGHPVLLTKAKQCLLFKIKTILTVEVARRPCRFRHDVDALACAGYAECLIVLSFGLFCVCRHL